MHMKSDLQCIDLPEGAFVRYSCGQVLKDEGAEAHYDACRRAREETTGKTLR